MKLKITLSVLLLLALSAATASSFAQSNPLYVHFEGVPASVKGALYTPDDPQQKPHVGILVMHRTTNYMNIPACTELSQKGFLVLCMNSRSDNNEAVVYWEAIALDVAAGVNFLSEQPGITKVLLWGWSSGGDVITYYQSLAENGPSACQGPNKLINCSEQLEGLMPADGLILVDAHLGGPVNLLRGLNPAVLDESQPDKIDPNLDPFNPKNGYNPDGPSKYSEQFKKRYFKAQAGRMNKLIGLAMQKLTRIRNGKYFYPDNDVFVVPRGEGARLVNLDPSIHNGTVKPQKLLKNDGSIATEIIESIHPPDPQLAAQNTSFEGGTMLLTIRSFLSANAVRATDSMESIDYCSTNDSPPCHLQKIHAPLLITAMGANSSIRDNEIHYDLAASPDKDFIVIEGATHGQNPCLPCQSFQGQYLNATKNFYKYVQDWINKRF